MAEKNTPIDETVVTDLFDYANTKAFLQPNSKTPAGFGRPYGKNSNGYLTEMARLRGDLLTKQNNNGVKILSGFTSSVSDIRPLAGPSLNNKDQSFLYPETGKAEYVDIECGLRIYSYGEFDSSPIMCSATFSKSEYDKSIMSNRLITSQKFSIIVGGTDKNPVRVKADIVILFNLLDGFEYTATSYYPEGDTREVTTIVPATADILTITGGDKFPVAMKKVIIDRPYIGRKLAVYCSIDMDVPPGRYDWVASWSPQTDETYAFVQEPLVDPPYVTHPPVGEIERSANVKPKVIFQGMLEYRSIGTLLSEDYGFIETPSSTKAPYLHIRYNESYEVPGVHSRKRIRRIDTGEIPPVVFSVSQEPIVEEGKNGYWYGFESDTGWSGGFNPYRKEQGDADVVKIPNSFTEEVIAGPGAIVNIHASCFGYWIGRTQPVLNAFASVTMPWNKVLKADGKQPVTGSSERTMRPQYPLPWERQTTPAKRRPRTYYPNGGFQVIDANGNLETLIKSGWTSGDGETSLPGRQQFKRPWFYWFYGGRINEAYPEVDARSCEWMLTDAITKTLPSQWRPNYGGFKIGDRINDGCGGIEEVVCDWEPDKAYSEGDFLIDTNGNIQLVETEGVSGSAMPDWKTEKFDKTTDGTVVWNCVLLASDSTDGTWLYTGDDFMGPPDWSGSKAVGRKLYDNAIAWKLVQSDMFFDADQHFDVERIVSTLPFKTLEYCIPSYPVISDDLSWKPKTQVRYGQMIRDGVGDIRYCSNEGITGVTQPNWGDGLSVTGTEPQLYPTYGHYGYAREIGDGGALWWPYMIGLVPDRLFIKNVTVSEVGIARQSGMTLPRGLDSGAVEIGCYKNGAFVSFGSFGVGVNQVMWPVFTSTALVYKSSGGITFDVQAEMVDSTLDATGNNIYAYPVAAQYINELKRLLDLVV